MNITKRHNISIVVNGEQLEVESQDKINLRINNTIYNPEKVSVTQSEYSFSFNVPQTPKNNKIFGFANVPSVKGKFVKQFNTYVYADNVEIFNGLLRISSISDGNYKCNLISMKNNSIDEIFGDSKMNQVRWEVPYNGTETQNAINEQEDPDYFFPLVAYGAFQKEPYLKITGEDSELKYFTSTNLLDKWTKFYNETFVPSPKLIELIKKMIEQKGYTYSGNVFSDDLINKLYLSSSITSEQDPAYNLGGNRGKLKVDFSYVIPASKGTRAYRGKVERELKYPEDYHHLIYDKKRDDEGEDLAYIYNLWDKEYAANVSANNDDMWQDGYIVIPHSGYYKIKINANIQITDTATSVEDSYPYLELANNNDYNSWELHHKPYTRSMNLDNLSYDIQLMKNGNMDLEFIASNRINSHRNPLWLTDTYSSTYVSGCDYPHETPIAYSGRRPTTSQFGGQRGGLNTWEKMEYYYQPEGRTRGYDPMVNPDFVMGMSTAANAWGIIKKGKSWDISTDYYGENNYYCVGYNKYKIDYSSGTAVNSYEYNTNYQDYTNTTVPKCTYTRYSAKQANGNGYAVVWLEKNDVLSLHAMHPQFLRYKDEKDDGVQTVQIVGTNIYGSVEIEAFSPKKNDRVKNWNSTSAFDKNLNLGNFLSEEETQKDFFNNFLTTFNLSCNIDNGNIDINKNVGINGSNEAVEVDNRINVKDVETEIIDFPTSIQVKWTTSDEESGFYHSVSDEHINDDDWKDWADIGTEKVMLIKNDFNKNEISKTSKFSYNWMMPFKLSDYYVRFDIPGQGGSGTTWERINHITDGNITLSLPIVAKDENFIDGANYEEMMQKDGRSLKQRLWFKDEATGYHVPNRNGAEYDDNGNPTNIKEYIMICTPTNLYQGKDVLNFTKEKDSLLMRYFNVNENVDSNYATIEVYLTPQEYMMVKNGAMVRFDNDRYQICTISGYDPTGGNKTKLKLMKL